MIDTILAQINWVDFVFIFILIYFFIVNDGFIDNFLEVAGFVFSLLFSYKLYPIFGSLLIRYFSLPSGLSNALGFFISWLFAELLLLILLGMLSGKLFKNIRLHPVNKLLGFIPAVFQGLVIFLFFVSLIFALPVRGQIKEDILRSYSGPFFVNFSQSFEKGIKNIFSEAINETLNFLTIKPQSNETLDLSFKLNPGQLKSDNQSELIMLELVNTERRKRGLPALQIDINLSNVGRDYAREMLINGFFSHTSAVNGTSPAERANQAGIQYLIIGENLAYAPDVYVAHQGLMNSEGHRKNILLEEYGKVGIGVIDAGIYGRMFVQEFTN